MGVDRPTPTLKTGVYEADNGVQWHCGMAVQHGVTNLDRIKFNMIEHSKLIDC